MLQKHCVYMMLILQINQGFCCRLHGVFGLASCSSSAYGSGLLAIFFSPYKKITKETWMWRWILAVYAIKATTMLMSIIIFYWRLIAPPTTQGHLRAFHKFKSHTSWLEYNTKHAHYINIKHNLKVSPLSIAIVKHGKY